MINILSYTEYTYNVDEIAVVLSVAISIKVPVDVVISIKDARFILTKSKSKQD